MITVKKKNSEQLIDKCNITLFWQWWKKKKAVEMDIILDLSSQQVHMKEVLGLH